jgi:ferric-dicitrate binding protein FerR (iron transport regulator)
VNCETFRDRVHELIYWQLPPADAEAAQAHVVDCPACAEHLESARRFDRLLSGKGDAALEAWSAHAASVRAMAASAAPIRRAPQTSPAAPARRGILRKLIPYAAVAAAAALVALFVVPLSRGPATLAEGEPTELARGTRVYSGEGRQLEAEETSAVLVRPGTRGSVVRLDSGTVLFRVVPGNAFAVETPQGTVSVAGTSFHVVVAPDHQVSVTVHSGRVKFASGSETTVLAPGDRLEIDARGARRLINGRRIDQLETDLGSARRAPAVGDRGPVAAARSEPVPPQVASETVKEFLTSDEGRALLAAAIKAANDQAEAQRWGRMFDAMISRFAKDADLTEDQGKRLREIVKRYGAESREAGAALSEFPLGSPEDERERIRHEWTTKNADIERRKDEELKTLLSQSQYESYKKTFSQPSGFGPNRSKDKGAGN